MPRRARRATRLAPLLAPLFCLGPVAPVAPVALPCRASSVIAPHTHATDTTATTATGSITDGRGIFFSFSSFPLFERDLKADTGDLTPPPPTLAASNPTSPSDLIPSSSSLVPSDSHFNFIFRAGAQSVCRRPHPLLKSARIRTYQSLSSPLRQQLRCLHVLGNFASLSSTGAIVRTSLKVQSAHPSMRIFCGVSDCQIKGLKWK